MYVGLLLLLAALLAFKPNLADFHHVVGARSSIDHEIRDGNFIASLPVPAERGDIAFYEAGGKIYVRRLVALPGDHFTADDRGTFIDGKPLDTRLLDSGAHIAPMYSNYAVPPNRIIIGSGASGAFLLSEIDRPSDLRRGAVAFSTSQISRDSLFGIVIGSGYLFLLIFGPLIAERWLDPQERWYRPLKLVWYGLWTLILGVVLFVTLADSGCTMWQRVLVTLAMLNVRFTSLLIFFGASLQQSAIVGLITAVSGLLSAAEWARKMLRWSKLNAGAARA